MTQIGKLFKFQLDNKFPLFKQKSLKVFLMRLFRYLLTIVLVTFGLLFVFRKIAFLLGIQITPQFMAVVILVAQLISFCFDIGNVVSSLYLSKDNELLMVLPVTFNQLFVSKIFIIYVTDLIFNFLYILPVFIMLGIIGNVSILFYIMLVVLIPLMPLLPVALASIVSIPIMFIIKFFKRHPFCAIILLLVLVSAIFMAYMTIITNISGAFNIAEKQIETSIKLNAQIKSMGDALSVYLYLAMSLFSLKQLYVPFIFIVVAVGIMLSCFILIKPFYYKVATISQENSTTVNGKYHKFKIRQPFWELVINEIRSVFRSPSYIFQYFLFPIFMPLIVYAYDKLLITIAVNQAGALMIVGSHVLVLSIIALMSNIISASSISREGGTFYIAKTTPINPYIQVGAKITFNAIFTFASIIITTITTLIFTSLNPWMVIISSLSTIFLSFGHICHSFDMDLKNPVLDWYDNSEISTVGKSTTKSIIIALVLSLVMCMIYVLFSGMENMYVPCIVHLIISILYAFNYLHLLHIHTKYYYNKMEI